MCRSLLALLGMLFCAAPSIAQPARLVRDLDPSSRPIGSNPRSFVELGGITYFIANSPETGPELWSTDGSEGGTLLVKETYPGPIGGIDSPLVKLGGMLLFIAFDGGDRFVLWRTDGTTAGTVPVTAVNQEAYLGASREFRGRLFFSSRDADHAVELWVTDGTPDGTHIVKDINPGNNGSYPSQFVVAHDTLYFTATRGQPVNSRALWVTDGTADGTVQVTLPGLAVYELVAVDGAFLFLGRTDSTLAFWRFDFATAGVTRLATVDDPCYWLTPVPGGLVFVSGGPDNRQLWKTDGTQAGTGVLKVINAEGSAFDDPLGDDGAWNIFFRYGETVFFTASDPVHGWYSLWKTDGTASGTTLVTTQDGTWLRSVFAPFAIANGTVFIGGDDGVHGIELWRTDGTPRGTYLVKDILVSGAWLANATVFVRANDRVHGEELWKTDGTPGGTVLVKNISSDAVSGMYLADMVDVNGTLLFTPYRQSRRELWKSDGTSQGTVLVREIPDNCCTAAFTALNTRLIFNAGRDLWASDGTSQGTLPFLIGADLSHSTRVGSTLMVGGTGLWRTDGTAAGTVLLNEDVVVSTDLVAVNGTVFFGGSAGDYDDELWKSDGTADGTVLVKNIGPTRSSSPLGLANIGGRLFFSADDEEHGRELWTSDGTASGTLMIRDINPGPAGSSPTSLVEVDGLGFFAADDGVHGAELWRTGGTATQTGLWADINPGPAGSLTVESDTNAFTVLGSALFFVTDGGSGRRLWRAGRGGAAEVPVLQPFAPMVKPFQYGTGLTYPSIAAIDGKLWLAASDDVHGTELWRSDGTADGTRMLQDIAAGPAASAPSQFVAAGPNLFFVASTPENGRELWAMDRPAGPAPSLGLLVIMPPLNGTVFGPGIACGVRGTRCEVVLPEGARVGLEPVPAVGFFFSGWTGACGSATVTIQGTVICSASFSGTPPPTTAPIRLSLDAPSGIVQGTVVGRGWAFRCGARITSYELLLGGAPVAGIVFTPGTQRDDVPAIYGRECPSVGALTGFTFTLDSSTLSGNVQNLQVRVTDDKGSTATTNGLPVRK